MHPCVLASVKCSCLPLTAPVTCDLFHMKQNVEDTAVVEEVGGGVVMVIW